jgi:hypothetical protein
MKICKINTLEIKIFKILNKLFSRILIFWVKKLLTEGNTNK